MTMTRWRVATASTLIALALIAGAAGADVDLPSVIGSHMVLQRDRWVPIWGWADANEDIVVTVIGADGPVNTEKARAADDGTWKVKIRPRPAGGPYTITVQGRNTITLENVLFGEVWVCSGQSNMQWPVFASDDAEREVAEADYPDMRLFRVEMVTAEEPKRDTNGSWQVCTPETIPDFTAVGYFFGRKLHQELGVPVGLIQAAWGGTPAESWMSERGLKCSRNYEEWYAPLVARWETTLAAYPRATRNYNKFVLPRWQRAVREAELAGETPPGQPQPPVGPDHPHRPYSLFNGMISPILPYSIRGAIWYQGESNADRAYQYRHLFKDLIKDWRFHWQQGDFPFYFVQLANFMSVDAAPTDAPWPELREAQNVALELPQTGVALAIDIGDAGDIHPRNKQEVGRRLALNALAEIHGRDVVYQGPMFRRMEVAGSVARLYFWDGGADLIVNGEELTGFAIADERRKFVWAEARLVDGHVEVWSPEIAEPAAVRYAWSNNPVANLYNAAGLPASPFRTDQWPGVTIEAR